MVLAAFLCWGAVSAVHAQEAVPDGAASNDANTREEGWDFGPVTLRPTIDLRLRYEFVDQDGAAENANAVTLSGRLGVVAETEVGLTALVEFEGVTDFGSEQFNSTTNGQTDFPLVLDPAGLELNRALVSYTGLPDTEVIFGRQYLKLNNERFLGISAFRQNHQTYDAITVVNNSIEPLTLSYSYIEGVQTIFGNEGGEPPFPGELESDSHVARAALTLAEGQEIAVYGFWLDLDEDPANTTRTLGARATFRVPLDEYAHLPIEAEYARQSDFRNNPDSFGLDYVRVSGGVAAATDLFGGFIKLGYEMLGSDGERGVFTPLGDNHPFQGTADVFALGTPAAGLEDIFVELGATFPDLPFGEQVVAAIAVHDFETEEGDIDIGREIDAVIDYHLTENVVAQAKAAFFDGTDTPIDGIIFPDTTRVFTSIQFRQ